jgi:hypothetical protein
VGGAVEFRGSESDPVHEINQYFYFNISLEKGK